MTADPSGQPANDLQRRAYWYTQAGDVKKVTDGLQGIDYEYTYDNLHRLTGETNTGNYPAVGYTYNAIGNILTRTVGGNTYSYGYSGGHKHAVGTVTYNGTPYTYNYDNNGNMTGGPDFTDPATTATRTLTWNADNRPAQVVHVKGHFRRGVTVTTDFAYDGTGGRAKKVVQGSNTTFYVGAHYEVKDGVITKYIFAGSMRIAKMSGGATHYYHQDHLGSAVAMSDVNGSKVEGTEYMPFGSMRDHTGTAVSNYKYTDQEQDTETGLYYYHARYYDPIIGRFISADAIVQAFTDPQTLNRYSYVRNNPLIYTDPSGNFGWFAAAVVIGAVVGAVSSGAQSDWNPKDMVIGAAIGAAACAAGYGAGDWVYGLAKAASYAYPMFAAGIAGGAVGGAVGGGLSAAVYGGNIGEGIGQGTMLGGVGGGISGGLMAAEFPSSTFASMIGASTTAYITGGTDQAFESAFYALAASIASMELMTSDWEEWNADAHYRLKKEHPNARVMVQGTGTLQKLMQWIGIGNHVSAVYDTEIKYGGKYMVLECDGTKVSGRLPYYREHNSQNRPGAFDYDYSINPFNPHHCASRFGYSSPMSYYYRLNYGGPMTWWYDNR